MAHDMSQSAYARYCGRSQPYINKKVRDGTIPVDANGKIDPEQADAVLSRSPHMGKRQAGAGQREPGLASEEQPRTETVANAGRQEAALAAPEQAAPADSGNSVELYTRARAQREIAHARLDKIKLEREEGRVVERKAAERDAYGAARMLQQRLARVPAKLAPHLAKQDDPVQIEAMLRDELSEALEGFRDGLRPYLPTDSDL